MKRLYFDVCLQVILLLALAIEGCGSSTSPDTDAGSDGLVDAAQDAGSDAGRDAGMDAGRDAGGDNGTPPEVEISTQAVLLPAEVAVERDGEGTLTLTGDVVPDLEPGQVLVGTSGGGVLVRVRAVHSEGGQTVIETEPAALTDVIKRGRMELQQNFRLEDATLEIPPPGPGRDIGFENGALVLSGLTFEIEDVATVTLTKGSFKFDPGFDFNLDISDWQVQKFRCVASGRIELEVDAELEAKAITDLLEKDITVAKLTFPEPAGVFMIGWVPVVYEFFIEIKVGAAVSIGELGTVTAGYEMLAGAEVGADYQRERSPSWDAIGNFEFGFTPHAPQMDLHPLSVQVYAKPEVGIKFYKVVGPSISYKDYFELVGDYRHEEIGVELRKGAAVDLNFSFEIVDPISFEYAIPILDTSKVMLARLAFHANPASLGEQSHTPQGVVPGFYLWDDPVTVTGTPVAGCEVAGFTIEHLCDDGSRSHKGTMLEDEPIDASKVITVHFVPEGQGDHWSGEGDNLPQPSLEVTTEVFPPEAGEIVLYPALDLYPRDINLLVEAVPNPNFTFHHWEEDADGTDATTEVLVNGNQHLRAVFASVVPRELEVPGEYPTIQAALDAATYNDHVVLGAGTFQGEGNRDLDFHGRNVSLLGAGQASTTIDLSDPSGEHRLADLEDVTGLGVFDLTVSGAAGPGGLAALRLQRVPGFRLENVAFEHCGLPAFEAIESPGVVITGCRFADCQADYGVVDVTWARVENCVFENNTGIPLDISGRSCTGGVCTVRESEVRGCTFEHNDGGERQGGIKSEQVLIIDSVFTANQGCNVVELRDGRMEGCRLEDNPTGAVRVFGGAKFVECEFIGNSNDGRGGAAIDAADVQEEISVRGCTFLGNTTTGYGGALYGRNLAVLDSVFTGNSAEDGGGAIHCNDGSSISDCSFDDNQARVRGGAIDASETSIVRCQITNNRLTGELGQMEVRTGAGVRLTRGALIHSLLRGNQADTGRAGGADVADCWVADNVIDDNHVLDDGIEAGGLLATGETVVVSTSITANSIRAQSMGSSWDGGGGAWLRGVVVMRDCLVENNTAHNGKGGGLVVVQDAEARSCRILSNQADHDGGGVWIQEATLVGCDVVGNSGGHNGGGVVALFDARVASCQILSNDAAQDGGGVWLQEAELLDCEVANNTCEGRGGGVYCRGQSELPGCDMHDNVPDDTAECF